LQEVAGPGVALIDSAEETAKTVASLLAAGKLEHCERPAGSPRYFVTDVAERFERVGGAFLGAPLAGVATVTLD
jgi:glutamate racemase